MNYNSIFVMITWYIYIYYYKYQIPLIGITMIIDLRDHTIQEDMTISLGR